MPLFIPQPHGQHNCSLGQVLLEYEILSQRSRKRAGRLPTKEFMESYEGCSMREGQARVLVVCILFLTRKSSLIMVR